MKQLQTLSIVSPGFYGLNTQESGVTLSSNWASLTDNVVIDKYGRLGARKGWFMKTVDGVDELAGSPIRFMLEYITASNTSVILSAGNQKLFKNGVDGDVLVDITPSLYTITDNDWRGATIYDHVMMVQGGHEPVIYTESVSPAAQTMTDYTGAVQNYGTSYPKDVIAAYGRFWAHDGNTVYWSTDIADTAFPCFCGGTSGTLNIAAVLPNNVDTIEALAVHNDFLIILCKNNIVVYSGASNPIGVGFQLTDIISGAGCVSRNSIQSTGNDLIFLSDTGIRSLGRLIQEKSLPMRDLTKNIRDDFIKDMQAEIANYGSLDHVVSVYSELNAFYLISFPSTKTVYVLDMRQALEDGSSRCTVWYQYPAFSFLRTRDRRLLIGKANGIGLYTGYNDNGDVYRLRYFSHYLDFGSSTQKKILKQIKVAVFGGSQQQFSLKIGTDYDANYLGYPFTIDTKEVFEYGTTEYNVGYYSGGVVLDNIKSSVGGSGNIIQIGFEADVNGSELSVQAIDCFVKTGRNS